MRIRTTCSILKALGKFVLVSVLSKNSSIRSTLMKINNIKQYIKKEQDHRSNNNTDKILDVVFSRFRGFSFTKTLRQRPKGVTHMLSLCLVIQRCLRGTPLGFCHRVIVNEKPVNLEKTTSSVLSVFLLTYDQH